MLKRYNINIVFRCGSFNKRNHLIYNIYVSKFDENV